MDQEEKKLIYDIVWLLSVRSELTYWHSLRVSILAKGAAKVFRLDQERLFFAALVHDIGKIDIDEEILSAPRKLTELELRVVRRHPIIGRRILERVGVRDELALKAALEHHERRGGLGYPFQKEEVSQEVEVIAASDVFDATFIRRPYQKEKVDPVSVLESQRFDREIVRFFRRLQRERDLKAFLFREAEKIDREIRGGFPPRGETASPSSKTSTELSRLLGHRRCRPSRRALE